MSQLAREVAQRERERKLKDAVGAGNGNPKECQGECPNCGSDDIEFNGHTYDGDFIVYDGHCNKCGDNFNEFYFVKYSYSQRR